MSSEVEYSKILCKSALSVSRLPELDYCINPYVGCEHGCLYCYARSMIRDKKIASAWGRFVIVKENLPETLRAELKRKRRGTVGLSTVTDPYQPIESKLEYTRRCITMLSEFGFHVSIQTKSDLVLRDLEILKPGRFDVGVTITTIDDYEAGHLEPKAPKPSVRIQALEEISKRNIETWIFLGPIVPLINDDEHNLRAIVDVAKKTKSRIIYDKLNLKLGVLNSISNIVEDKNPDLTKLLPSMLTLNSDYWMKTSQKVEAVCREKCVECKAAFAYR